MNVGPTAAVFISGAVNTTVDTPASITLSAVDIYGNIVVSESRSITFTVTGASSSTTLTFSNGVVSRTIQSFVPTYVTVSLAGLAWTGVDISATKGFQISSGLLTCCQIICIPHVLFVCALLTIKGATTRYVILQPPDTSVDTSCHVVIRALDQYGNIAQAETRSVTLVANGTVTGAGLVAIVQGQGSKNIQNTAVGPVKVSLLDAFGITGVDFTSTQLFKFFPGGLFNTLLNMSHTCAKVTSVRLFHTHTYTRTSFRNCHPVSLPGATVSIVISDAWAGSVDLSGFVSLTALDQFGNIAAAESRFAFLASNGSITGLGNISFSNGLAYRTYRDSLPETALLSLSDPNFGWNVSSVRAVRFVPGTFDQPASNIQATRPG